MSSINRFVSHATSTATNHHGTVVPAISAKKQLVRLTLASMLWEDQFYVDGETSAALLAKCVAKVDAEYVSALAMEARSRFKLRHVPLALTRELARNGRLKADVLAQVIQRPDEMAEFLSIYWKDGKTALSNQVKKGLALAFGKFNEYQLAKWDKNSSAISLRDVMFLTHPKPQTKAQEELFKRVANEQLETPDTWETNLSAGANKGETFLRLMDEKKLGALAFLRNLRNMVQGGVSESRIRAYAKEVDVTKVLPFRYIAAARIMPLFEDMLEEMMLRSLASVEKIPGKTKVVIDVSGSMFGTKVSAKSDLDRFDAAAALAVLLREICEEVEIWSFSNDAVRVPPRRGFALVKAISDSQGHGGTMLGRSLKTVFSRDSGTRTIVFTDEQSSDRPNSPPNGTKGYIVNVASYQNGVNHSAWTTITGFSEAIVDYIRALESDSSLS
ncbi:vWFA domain containing protein [uncultured Caudovirales phage]|uniref:VWFA domain containing protein n=1 Tax=uncultured Caudovirales phage TaxID=2100421 RepID=A0A6J5LRV1_9CAUD|nr:vWFA domain containing protein [uncultured Caudovirales phage]